MEWSAKLLDEEAKRVLKNAELLAKKERLRVWTNFVPPLSNSTAIRDDNFKGRVCWDTRQILFMGFKFKDECVS